MSYLSRFPDKNSFYGTDIDGEAIAWCQSELSNLGAFVTNKAIPPLPFEDGFFDIIFSISVFTHLPEEMQFLWLEELRRVTRRDGYLLITTHGEELFSEAPDIYKRQLGKDGFFYSMGNGTEGLPDFYQTTFHTDAYIHEQCSKYFEIERILKKGIMSHQDLVICKNC